ncbi:MAG TPA: ABC transporter substrate-binding protein [Candidatus Fimenecus excrementavium]|nr:ABC transporter substrate-binding protein [Candidatus Fimenecus excrementavium]
MKTLKKILAVFLCAGMLLSFASCADKSQGDANGEDLEKITLCLDWTPNTNHTGIYVALAKGYFKEAGLDVTVVQPSESTSAAMCAAGQAQFAVEAQDTLAAAFTTDEPLGVTAVAALLQHNTSGIISRKGEGMDRPKGLENHTYSTWDSPIELAMLKAVVEKDGGDFSKVKLIPNNITDEAGALKAHQTDAVWIYYGWSGIAAELSGLDFDYFSFIDIDPVFDYYTPILIGNNAYMEQNPDSTKALLAALKKGYEYAIANPEEAAQILVDGDTTGSLKDSLELVTASQKWISGQYKAEVEQWGYIDPARWDAFYQWLWDNQLIEKELPAGTGFTNEYLS